MNAKEVSSIILQQLGGNRFIAMTGSSNLSYAVDAENRPYLSMKLSGLVKGRKYNYLKIALNADDTYSMIFQKITSRTTTQLMKALEKGIEPPPPMNIKENIFDGVYTEQLQNIFVQETGLYTTL